MGIIRNRTAAALVLAAGLAYPGPGSAQSAAQAPDQPPPEAVIVAEEAPPQGGSQAMAIGAGVGLLVGLAVLALIISTAE